MKHLVATISIFIGCISMARAEEPANAKPAAAAAWLTANPAAQVLDVRTKEEFAGGHLAKATLIPWTDDDFAARAAKELDPAKPVLVYCHSGGRSAKAAAKLAKLGFKDVRNLEGGILEWQKAGQPTIKPESRPRP